MGAGLLQPWHLIIILMVVLIVFGAGHLSELGGALGKGIRDFKEEVSEGNEVEAREPARQQALRSSEPVAAAVQRVSSPGEPAATRPDDI